MPQIVIVIDEFVDLMLTAPADVETVDGWLRNLALWVFILFFMTQRLSVNVITGVIKAGSPSRIAFRCLKTDSRTI